MNNIVSYIRVSGKGQLEGDGPERQREAVSKFRSEHNLVFHNEFFERAVSGTVDGMDRPAFTEMLEYISERPEDNFSIVVERIDRLARDLMVSEFLLAECRKRGIKVFAADQGQLIDLASDGGDPTRVLIRQIMGALAQWEKTMLVQKLAKARARIKEKTGRCGGRYPYGRDNYERKVLEYLKAAYKHGNNTLQMLATELNMVGFKTRDGKQWTRQNVHNIMHCVKGKE